MIVIIHGWSDEAKSFASLGKRLSEPAPEGIGSEVADIHLGDYMSMDDQISFDDLTDALNKAWHDRDLPTTPRSVDAIVHSTGGLVIRDWLTRFFTPETDPIKRLLMLAPANFGSPLAHKGRAFYGRAIKGWNNRFNTGTKILKGLEMASPYSWNLADKDIFADTSWYGYNRILCTVLIGNQGYRGISALANEPGSDGTVYVAAANLNVTKFTLDFTGKARDITKLKSISYGKTAFGILSGEDHSSIAVKYKKGRTRKQSSWEMIRQSLLVQDRDFYAWRDQLAVHNSEVTERSEKRRGLYRDSYQNTVVRVVDNHGTPVTDYVLELYANDDESARDQRLTQIIQEDVVGKVHPYGDDRSYRSFLLNCTQLYRLMGRNARTRIGLSVTAEPNVDERRNQVGYKTETEEDIGSLVITNENLKEIFQPHRTVLITIRLQRYQKDAVFCFEGV